jgi:hypothetical protein
MSVRLDTWLDLPRPPSVNRFMRKLGNKTPCVRAWVGEADYLLWAARKVRTQLVEGDMLAPNRWRLLTRSGCRRSKLFALRDAPLLDHFARSRQQCSWDGEAQNLRSLR